MLLLCESINSLNIGVKLRTNAVTTAVAAQIYHRFLEAVNDSSYDPYVSVYKLLRNARNVINIAFFLAYCCNCTIYCKQTTR